MEPAIRPELAQHGLEVVERFLRFSQPDFQVGGRDGELDLAERIGGLLGKSLEARQRGGGLIFLAERLGDLFLNAGVAGEEGFEASPDLEGLLILLGALVDAAESLKDIEQIGASRLAGESALKGFSGILGLADQDECLPEIIGGQGIIGPVSLGLFERGDGRGVLPCAGIQAARGSARPHHRRVSSRADCDTT